MSGRFLKRKEGSIMKPTGIWTGRAAAALAAVLAGALLLGGCSRPEDIGEPGSGAQSRPAASAVSDDGGVDMILGPVDETLEVTAEQMEAVREVVERRLEGCGIEYAAVYADTECKQLVIHFSGDPGDAARKAQAVDEALLCRARLAFHIGDEKEEVKDEDGNPLRDESGNIVYKPAGELVVTGDEVAHAKATMEYAPDGKARPVVDVEFKPEGREKFAEATKRQCEAGMEPISIWLDGEMLAAPDVAAPILDGVARISVDMDADECQRLAALINAGALPFALEEKTG